VLLPLLLAEDTLTGSGAMGDTPEPMALGFLRPTMSPTQIAVAVTIPAMAVVLLLLWLCAKRKAIKLNATHKDRVAEDHVQSMIKKQSVWMSEKSLLSRESRPVVCAPDATCELCFQRRQRTHSSALPMISWQLHPTMVVGWRAPKPPTALLGRPRPHVARAFIRLWLGVDRVRRRGRRTRDCAVGTRVRSRSHLEKIIEV
jgi:hypothetical protein